MATSSTVPWQLLAKGRQKYKGTPDRYARLSWVLVSISGELYAMWLLEQVWTNMNGHGFPPFLLQ